MTFQTSRGGGEIKWTVNNAQRETVERLFNSCGINLNLKQPNLPVRAPVRSSGAEEEPDERQILFTCLRDDGEIVTFTCPRFNNYRERACGRA